MSSFSGRSNISSCCAYQRPALCGLRSCRISPPHYLAEWCKRRLNGLLVLFCIIYCSGFSFRIELHIFLCSILSVLVKWLDVRNHLQTDVSSVRCPDTVKLYWLTAYQCVSVCAQLSKLSLHQIESDREVEPLPELTPEQIAADIDDEQDFHVQITKLEEQLSRMKPNLAAIAEYRKKVVNIICH